MKKTLNVIIYLLILNFASCQNNTRFNKAEKDFTEIGVLDISPDKSLKIFKNPEDSREATKITFDKVYFGKNSGSIEINSSSDNNLKPFTIHSSTSDSESKHLTNTGLGPVGAALMFRVIAETPTYFKVLMDDNTQEIGYIKKDERKTFNSKNAYFSSIDQRNNIHPSNYFVFETWLDYMKRVEYINATNFEIFDKINGKIIKKGSKSESVRISVINRKGDWIQVNYNELLKNKTGWLQWRKNSKLTIEITENLME
ncbi:hypothetical protein [uncultured Flavobacterium sp.]|uniref:hypothetical protein n=1 Tax=uncultured Flavobacterium sp. TaxID=165435 RepID=UPI002930FD78|nr:hypothetical protein [uncultured Flavobacterium sp.]